MKRSPTASSALVRFVYDRCGAAYARPRDGRAAAERGPRQVKSSEAEALQRAVQDSWPAIISPDVGPGALPMEFFKELPKLQQLKELCGHRQVTVRLPKARFAWLPAGLAFHWPSLRHVERQTFGDVRKKMPYEDVKQMALRDVIDALSSREMTSQAPPFYAASVPLRRDLPELALRLGPLQEALEEVLHLSVGPPVANAPVMYLGAGQQRTPLHCDPTENVTLVLEVGCCKLLVEWGGSGGLWSSGSFQSK